jgi:hypothetical protein
MIRTGPNESRHHDFTQDMASCAKRNASSRPSR